MAAFALVFAVQLISLFFVMVSVKRLYAYIHLYRFDESVYTLLFGFLHLRYFVLLYIVMVAVTVIAETIYAFSLLPS